MPGHVVSLASFNKILVKGTYLCVYLWHSVGCNSLFQSNSSDFVENIRTLQLEMASSYKTIVHYHGKHQEKTSHLEFLKDFTGLLLMCHPEIGSSKHEGVVTRITEFFCRDLYIQRCIRCRFGNRESVLCCISTAISLYLPPLKTKAWTRSTSCG